MFLSPMSASEPIAGSCQTSRSSALPSTAVHLSNVSRAERRVAKARLATAMASAPTIRIAATANVMLIPVATASGRAVVMSIVAEAAANTAPRTDAPVMSPRLRDRLSMPEMTPRWSGLTCMRRASTYSARGQRLFNRPIRTPAHFPEVGFEPGGLLEDHDQLCLAGRRGVEIGKTFQVRPRFRRDLLVGCTGILGDPNAIWVRCSERIASPGEPRRDLCVADYAGGKRHLERQQITAHSRVEHVACIGQHLDRRRGLFKIAGRQAPAGAELHMQVHLDVENGREAGRCLAHVSELG